MGETPRCAQMSLLDYCNTDKQRQIITSYLESGSMTKTAKTLGVDVANTRKLINVIKTRAAKAGFSPDHDMTHTVPDGFHVKGVSTLYGEDGEKKIQWVKSAVDKENEKKLLDEFVDGLCERVNGKAKRIQAPKVDNKNLLTIYPLGDPHVGQFSWGVESGEDYDLKIAISDNLRATERVIESAPASELALIVNVGDLFHADNFTSRTPNSGAPLDTDTRLPKVFQGVESILTHKIDLTLQKHKHVHIRNAIGNHDITMSYCISRVLKAYYSNEPRVTVHDQYTHYWYFPFHKNLIGVTHGDKVKLESLGEIMAADQAEQWGKTTFRYWYTGHIHHKRQFELRGCMAESFRTIAPRDAWNTEQGYRSERDMCNIVIDKDYGEVERHTCNIRMIKTR